MSMSNTAAGSDDTSPEIGHGAQHLANLCERGALWLLIAIIAWSQFPLGSARPWAWSLLVMLIAVNWLVWLPAGLIHIKTTLTALRRAVLPLALMLAVLIWAALQASPATPVSWHHPIWRTMHDALGGSGGAVSLNPFDTITEAMKLLSYVMAGWLAFVLASRHEYANRLFVGLFVIGVVYAAYGLALSVLGTNQITLLENAPTQYGRAVTGGFGYKNSFATYAGMCVLIGVCLLVRDGSDSVVARRGPRTLLATALQYLLGPGAKYLVGIIVILLAFVAANSRAGLFAALVGGFAAFAIAMKFASRKNALRWGLAGGAAAVVIFFLLLVANGEGLAARFGAMIEVGNSGELRPIMWQAAETAIQFHALRGIGLGAYHDAYHLYANQYVPFVIDRAHNDYLEFVAGLGIPAAAAWLLALTLIVGRCLVGALKRRRRQTYAVAAVACTTLVAVHSAFDFSLQMPAVALLFAVILGIGAAQSYSSKKSA